jgi:hypothetical protein
MFTTPSFPNYKMFWLFEIHYFHYVSRHSVYLIAYKKNLYLEKPKILIIWNGVCYAMIFAFAYSVISYQFMNLQ